MKKLLIYAASLMVSLGTTSCFKDFDEMQVNPNYPTEVDPGYLFANATFSRVGGTYGVQAEDFNMTASGLWAQQYSKIQYVDEDWYEYRSNAVDAYWKFMYSGSQTSGTASLYDLELALKTVRDQKAFNLEQGNDIKNDEAFEGAILVMRSYLFSVITDMWGDVPYSEAFKTKALGFENTITQPKYDAQEDIYVDLLAQLEEANTLLSHGGTVDGAADVIYGGNASNWRKFANSLRARLLIHLSKATTTIDVQGGLNDIFSNPADYPIFTSNEDDAMLVYPGSQPYEHPFFENYVRDKRDDHAISLTIMDLLKNNNDSRMFVYSTPTPKSIAIYNDQADDAKDPSVLKWTGQENGVPKDENFQLSERSRIGVLYRATANGVSDIMSYSELKFIEAQYHLMTGNQGGADMAFQEGVRASFYKQYGLMESYGINAATFVNQNVQKTINLEEVVGFDGNATSISTANVEDHLALLFAKIGTTATEQNVSEQKFLAIFSNGPEAFNEVRRTGYPTLDKVRGGTRYQDQYVKPYGMTYRFPYVTSEFSTNSDNLSKVNGNIQGTMWGEKVWWATNSPDVK